MPLMQSNTISLYYDIVGRGPPLCLIIGYRLSASAWPDSFLKELARHFTLITFDHRGTGRSDKPTDGYALDNMASDVVGLLDGLKIERAHILGFSMGGAIAQELAINAPQRVDRLILFATFCGGIFGVPAESSVLRQVTGLAGLSAEDAARQIWPVTYSAHYLAAHKHRVEAQMRREIVHPTPLDVARKQYQAISNFSSYFRLPSIRAETLVATGTGDILVPPANSRIIHSRMSHSRLHMLPDLPHRAMWEAPEDMAHVVAAFLKEASTRTPLGR